jgi:hypothetical protein
MHFTHSLKKFTVNLKFALCKLLLPEKDSYFRNLPGDFPNLWANSRLK